MPAFLYRCMGIASLLLVCVLCLRVDATAQENMLGYSLRDAPVNTTYGSDNLKTCLIEVEVRNLREDGRHINSITNWTITTRGYIEYAGQRIPFIDNTKMRPRYPTKANQGDILQTVGIYILYDEIYPGFTSLSAAAQDDIQQNATVTITNITGHCDYTLE